MFLLKHAWFYSDLWFLQEHIQSFYIVVAFSETTLNGYNVMALNPNPNGEYEWDFLFQEHQALQRT